MTPGKEMMGFDIEPKVTLGAHLYIQKGDSLKLAPVSETLKLIGKKKFETCVQDRKSTI